MLFVMLMVVWESNVMENRWIWDDLKPSPRKLKQSGGVYTIMAIVLTMPAKDSAKDQVIQSQMNNFRGLQ